MSHTDARFQSLFEQSSDGIVLIDGERHFIDANRKMLEMLGYSKIEFLARGLSDVHSPASLQQGLAAFDATVETGQIQCELQFLRSNGESFPAEISASRIELDGRFVVQAIVRDVSERREVERQREESVRMLQLVLDAIPVRVFWKDDNSIFLGCNRRFADDAGLASPQDVVGKSDLQLPSRDRAELYRRDDLDVIESGRPKLNYEETLPRADGTRMWVSMNKIPLRDAGGNAIGLLGVYEDITERKRTEEALRTRVWQQAAIADLGNYALGETDLDVLMAQTVTRVADTLNVEYSVVLELQPGGEELMGRAGVGYRSGVVGTVTVPAGSGSQAGYTLQTHEPIIVDDLRTESRFAIHPTLIEHGVISGVTIIIGSVEHPWGVLCAHSVRVRSFSEDDLNFLQAAANVLANAIARDRAEREGRQLEAQLRHAQKMQAVGQLAGGVAHDFNNILTAILGNVELSLDTLRTQFHADDPLLVGLGQIERSAQRAAKLTRQLLMFSRRDVTKPEVLDLNRVLAELERMLARLVTEQITLSIVPRENLRPVRADAGQIEQVIMNLVVNARDAMPKGGRLTLETANVDFDEAYVASHPDSQAGLHVMLAVSDTGHGMSPEVAQRVFEPFFTTKPMELGTGLGLATVYGIVTHAGGHVLVDSEPGVGTRFRVYLPATKAEVVLERRDAPPAEADARGRGETILVCEDDESVLRLIEGLLRDAGYVVLAAESARTALEIASKHPGRIDLLITDVVMPEKNGHVLSGALMKARPDLRTIFVSGYTSNVIARHGVLEAHVDFLAKPFSRKAMLSRVREVLDRRPATAAD